MGDSKISVRCKSLKTELSNEVVKRDTAIRKIEELNGKIKEQCSAEVVKTTCGNWPAALANKTAMGWGRRKSRRKRTKRTKTKRLKRGGKSRRKRTKHKKSKKSKR